MCHPKSARPMHRWLVAALLIGCGDDAPLAIDAAVDTAVPVALDCSSYCAEIQANCTGTNAQYPDLAHCMATCGSFAVGTSTVNDTSGNSLGCRIYHAGAPAKMNAATHCVHAGPGGDAITASAPSVCSGGDICTSFCALEIKACGSLDEPLPGDPRDSTNNHLFQYQNMAECLSLCADFDKKHDYSIAAAGDSLACRFYHATNAAIAVMPNAMTHCAHTAPAPTGPCAGAASP